jgi:hypothetical protein
MRRQQAGRAESQDTSRVEYLLELLGGLSQVDPSPAVRERLSELSSHRLQNAANTGLKPLAWLRPIFAVALLVVLGLITLLTAHLWQKRPLRAGNSSRGHPASTLSDKKMHDMPTAHLPENDHAAFLRANHLHSKSIPNPGSRRMVVQLPYSNSAIATGTDATIQVSMSQSELLSLGFPVNASLHDRRVIAELTLGDDGLPRAVSLPLPLEVMKEKK